MQELCKRILPDFEQNFHPEFHPNDGGFSAKNNHNSSGCFV
jgi:hypothetical protein